MNTSIPSTSIEILKTKTISKRGGARIGAGRKPKLKFEARELFNASVDENWGLLMKKVWEAVKNGDKDMIRFVLEQKIGKPAQAIDIKKEEIKISYDWFFQPKIRESVRIFEDQLKGEITKSIVAKGEQEEG